MTQLNSIIIPNTLIPPNSVTMPRPEMGALWAVDSDGYYEIPDGFAKKMLIQMIEDYKNKIER
jgi:hypothetical protein